MLSLMAQVLMDEVIHCHTYSDQGDFNTKEAKILQNDNNAASSDHKVKQSVGEVFYTIGKNS